MPHCESHVDILISALFSRKIIGPLQWLAIRLEFTSGISVYQPVSRFAFWILKNENRKEMRTQNVSWWGQISPYLGLVQSNFSVLKIYIIPFHGQWGEVEQGLSLCWVWNSISLSLFLTMLSSLSKLRPTLNLFNFLSSSEWLLLPCQGVSWYVGSPMICWGDFKDG